MKLLLTSGGVTNASIHSALERLLGRPVAESRALCVPTAQWGHPMCDPTSVQSFVAAGPMRRHSSGLGWASLGVLELTALPSIGKARWVPWVREADVLFVDGGRRHTYATGCASPDLPISFLHCPIRSGWASALEAW
jgi:dipeptidase E